MTRSINKSEKERVGDGKEKDIQREREVGGGGGRGREHLVRRYNRSIRPLDQ